MKVNKIKMFFEMADFFNDFKATFINNKIVFAVFYSPSFLASFCTIFLEP